MKIWILLAIAGLLLILMFGRERFTETSTIRAPPYFEGEQVRIYSMLSGPSRKVLKDKAKLEKPLETNETKLTVMAGGYVSPAVEDFYTKVYAPATTTLNQAQVDTYIATRTGPLKNIEKEAITEYFLNQTSIASTGYLDILKDLGQETGVGGPTGSTGGTGGTGGTGTTGSTGTTGATGTTAGATAGGTTGGSSVTAAAPNAGGVRGRQMYGPVFTSLGSTVSGAASETDTSLTNQYPEVMGGMGDTTSVRGPGGIRSPSQNWLLTQSGALPSTASLGSDGNSGYLPYSRTPGDQDTIPDPYRMSRNFSTASYSSKTDPVPFLTDFSAFLK